MRGKIRTFMMYALLIFSMTFAMPAYGDALASDIGDASSGQDAVLALEQARYSALHTPVSNPDISLSAVLGYDGSIVYSKCIPITVTVANSGADVTGSLAVNVYRDRNYYDRFELPVYVPASGERTYTLPVTLIQKQSTFTIELISNDVVLASVNASPDMQIAPSTALVGVLSSDPTNLGYMSINTGNDAMMRGEYFQTLPLTLDTFPSTISLIDTFNIIVVDDIDMRKLTDAQQSAFDEWLRNGGVAIVGGGAQAATTYPFFQQYTDITVDGVAYVKDVTPALLEYCGIIGEVLGEDVLICRQSNADSTAKSSILVSAIASDAQSSEVTASHTSASDEVPLISMTEVDDGLVYSSAFDLAARPLTSWSEISSLWQRIVLKSASNIYSSLFGYDDSKYFSSNNSYVLKQIPVPNSANLAPVICLLAGYLLLTGIGAYLLLKRIDKRELLWLSIPATAICVALVIYAISVGSEMNEPLAVSYSSVAYADGESKAVSEIAVTSKNNDESIISAGEGTSLTPTSSDDNYMYSMYEDQDYRLKTPSELNYRYVLETEGAAAKVGVPGDPAWSVEYMQADLSDKTASTIATGSIDSALWFEDDGIHATFTNSTEYLLHDCALVTSWGFSYIGELAPGQTADAMLLNPTDEQQTLIYDTQQKGESYMLNGVMSSHFSLSGMMLNDSGYIYTALNNATMYNGVDGDMLAVIDGMSRSEVSLRNVRQSIVQTNFYSNNYDGNNSMAVFIGFNDDIGKLEITLNDSVITRTAHVGAVVSKVNFHPVGKDGMIFYTAGTLAPEVIFENADGTLTYTGASYPRNMTIQLKAAPIFGFTLPNASAIDIEEICVNITSWDIVPNVDVYNWNTNGWERKPALFLDLIGDESKPYINADGQFAIKLSLPNGANEYGEVLNPAFALSGHLK